MLAIVNWNILLLLLSVVIHLSASSTSCDDIKTCRNGPSAHTMCKYPEKKYSSLCGNRADIRSKCSRAEQQEIEDAHNHLRSFVASGRERRGINGPQPRAKNMMPMTWDSQLATVAQRWANQCSFGHDECRDDARFKVGQNAVYKSFSNEFPKNLTELIMMWYDEVKDFDYRLVNKLKFTNAFVLHYTQLVWAKTNKIGCGCIRYKKFGTWFTTYLICNYGPAGNIIGRPVYETY